MVAKAYQHQFSKQSWEGFFIGLSIAFFFSDDTMIVSDFTTEASDLTTGFEDISMYKDEQPFKDDHDQRGDIYLKKCVKLIFDQTCLIFVILYVQVAKLWITCAMDVEKKSQGKTAIKILLPKPLS